MDKLDFGWDSEGFDSVGEFFFGFGQHFEEEEAASFLGWAGLGYIHRQQAGRWVLVACQMEGEVSQGGPRGEKQKREKMWAGWRIDQMVFILFNGFSFFWFDSIQNWFKFERILLRAKT
jgi:hypothetical protein